MRTKGPRRRTAEQRDELAPFHSMTSSARASNIGGTSSPSAFAVLRLIAISYFVGVCTERSVGFAARSQNDVRRERDQFRRISATAVGIARRPAGVDPHVATDGPTRLMQPL